MPLAYGYPLHTDDSHTGSAKRNGAGGVAALGLFKEILAYAEAHSQIELSSLAPTEGGASLFTPGPDGALEILLNARFENGQYRLLALGEVAWKFRLDPNTGELTIEWSDSGIDPCQFVIQPWTMPNPIWNVGNGEKIGIVKEEDDINIPIGNTAGNTPVMQYFAYRIPIKIEAECIDDGGVVTTYILGWTVDTNKFLALVPNVTGAINSTDTSAYAQQDWNRVFVGSDPFRLTLTNPPLLRPATYRIRYWYLKTI